MNDFQQRLSEVDRNTWIVFGALFVLWVLITGMLTPFCSIPVACLTSVCMVASLIALMKAYQLQTGNSEIVPVVKFLE